MPFIKSEINELFMRRLALTSHGGRNPPASRLWRFDSVPAHSVAVYCLYSRRAGARLALIRPTSRFESGAWDSSTSSWPGRQTGKAASSRGWCLWVRLPPRLLVCFCADLCGFCVPWSNGEGVRFTPGRWGFDSLGDDCRCQSQKWAAGPMGRRLACNQETGVRLPGGPLGS